MVGPVQLTERQWLFGAVLWIAAAVGLMAVIVWRVGRDGGVW